MKSCKKTKTKQSTERQEIADEVLLRRKARTNALEFLKFVWWKPWTLYIGKHTREICKEIDVAVDNYFKGISTRIKVAVPYRHGKSDLISRMFPAYFLGRCISEGYDPDIIMSGYSADLVEGFSKDCQNIIRSDNFKALFPTVELSHNRNAVGKWRLQGKTGEITAAGIGGSLMGKGGDLIILDDYCKNRQEARSEVYRKRTWGGFRDLMNRRAPVSIVFVLATPWHIDDVQGRIDESMENDKNYPRFKTLKFPATNKDGSFLFPERFPDSWYISSYALEGKLAAALLDCSPVPEGGERFDVSNVKIHSTLVNDPKGLPDFPDVRYKRAWDLASSQKERDSDDPDFTVGILGTVTNIEGMLHLWIKDAVFGKWEAPKRNEVIKATAINDGSTVSVHVEGFAAYKDAFTILQGVLRGVRIVRKSTLPGDKSVKCADLEPIFDVGNVHLLEGEWNEEFNKQFSQFPNGKHDDFPDATAIIYHETSKPKSSIVQIA